MRISLSGCLLVLISLPVFSGTTAFVNVNVVPMTNEIILEEQTVLVRNDRIVRIGQNLDLPKGTVRIDGKNKYLMPGLAEMHGHTPVPGGNPDSEFVRNMLFLYVANGVTTVRGMLGAPGQLELRRLVQDREVMGPTLYLAGPSFNGNSISSPTQAVERVERQVREGWDLLKVHPGLTRDEFDAMAVTASKVGIRFGGHVPQDVGLMHALEMGQHTFDHIDGYLQHLGVPENALDTEELDAIASITRDAGAWIVPTLVLWDHVIGLGDPDEKMAWPELAYWPENQVQNWHRSLKSRHDGRNQENLKAYSRARSQVLKALAEKGAGILMGTDSPQIFSVPGFSIHREMAAMSASGLSNYEILASGTRNVGIYLQGKDAFGTIAPGNRADLILTNRDPLADLSAVADRVGVMVRGNWLPEAEIQERLALIRRSVSSRL